MKKDPWAYLRKACDFGRGVTVMLRNDNGVYLLFTNKMPKLEFKVNNVLRVLEVEWSAGESDDAKLAHYLYTKTRIA